MSDFTEADVTAVAHAYCSNPVEPCAACCGIASTVLAAVVPAMRDRWLVESADQLRRNLDEHPRRGTQEWRTGYDDAAFWLLARRSG